MSRYYYYPLLIILIIIFSTACSKKSPVVGNDRVVNKKISDNVTTQSVFSYIGSADINKYKRNIRLVLYTATPELIQINTDGNTLFVKTLGVSETVVKEVSKELTFKNGSPCEFRDIKQNTLRFICIDNAKVYPEVYQGSLDIVITNSKK